MGRPAGGLLRGGGALDRGLDERAKEAFAGIGEGGDLFFAGLTIAQRPFAGYHARQILLLRERSSTARPCTPSASTSTAPAYRQHVAEERAKKRGTKLPDDGEPDDKPSR